MRTIVFAFLATLCLATDIAASEPPNLVLITLDTTRVDHLSAYGYAQPTSPHLEAFAAEGVRFDGAHSPVGLTGPAHTTMLTGLYPHQHGAVRNGIRVSPDVPTLGELLQARGYATAAFVSGWTLKRKLSGLDRGFQVYDDDMSRRTRFVTSERDGRLTARAAVDWLRENHDGRFFLWVHFFDPHAPYRRRLGVPIESGNPKITAYDKEIRYADAQTARILEEIDRLGLRSRTVVVITADHGESLGEGGAWGHSFSVRPEVLAIPLLLRFPGRLPEGRVVQGPVSLIDLFPTMAGLLGLPDLPQHEGLDLTPYALGVETPDLDRVTWFAAYPGVVRRTLKFLTRPSSLPIKAGYRQRGTRFVWDLKKDEVSVEAVASWQAADPSATATLLPPSSNGHAEEARASDRIRAAVQEWLRPRVAHVEDDQLPDLSDEDIQRLKGLGYLP